MTTAVVIGAGHNGLVAGVLLARAGLEVTVLEAAPEAGGCLWSETLPSGHRLERGAVEHASMVGLVDELGLQRHGLHYVTRPVMTGAAYADGTVRRFHAELGPTVDELGADGPGYATLATLAARLFALLDAFDEPPTPGTLAAGLRDVTGGDELFRLMLSSAEVVLERRLADPHLRGALAMQAAHSQMPPWAPGTGLFALLLPAAHETPPARPLGGSAALVGALVGALHTAGGTLRTEAPVHRIRGAARGAAVGLAHGEALPADLVVSSLDVARTVELLADPPAALCGAARAVGSGRLNVAELKVDLAFDGRPDLGPLEVAPGAIWLLQREPGAIGRAFGDIVAGRVPQRPSLMWTSPSAHDPSAAPAGGAIGWLSTFVPLRPVEGKWTRDREQETVGRAFETLRLVTGEDVGRRACATVVTGPEGWARRLGSRDGNPNHLDLSLDQLLGWRPPGMAGHRTPLPWLYLSGSGTHPGGGLTGLPGRGAAAAALADLDGGRRRPPRRLRRELASLAAGLRLYRSLRRDGGKGWR